MARTPRKHPKPNLRLRNKHYELRWYWAGKLYEIRLGAISKQRATVIRDATAVALADAAEFPDEIKAEPTLKRYLAQQAGINANSTDDILSAHYIAHLKAQNQNSLWPGIVKGHLKRALDRIGALQDATSREIQMFLDALALETSPSTSNRARTALSGFFTFLRKMGHLPKNYKPMENVTKKREETPPHGIVIWEKNEIPALLTASDTRRDGIAIWIAILSGLRRGEIARLEWTDVSETIITVQKSKTGKKRLVPLSKRLAERLSREKKRSKKIVPWPDAYHGWISAAKKLVDIYLPRALPAIYKRHPEKFSWNPFRHTFASRHAQAGLSLDIIAAWLGDSPKVCKEHYARHVPANMRDSRIDIVDG